MGSSDDIFTVQGHSDLSRDPRLDKLPATVQRTGVNRQSLDVSAALAYAPIGTDAAEAGSTSSVINATAHAAKRGDLIRITSGTFSGDLAHVYSVTTDSISLGQTFSGAIAAGVTFEILRLSFLRAAADGTLAATLSTSPTVNQGLPAASGIGWRSTEYGTTGLPNAYFNIFGVLEIPTTVIADPFTGSPWSFLNSAGGIHGSTAHDAVDTNYPVKTGGRAFTDGTTEGTAVATGDRTDSFYDFYGYQQVKNRAQEDAGTTLTAINTTYNNVTTTASSADITTRTFRTCDLIFTLVSSGTPTDIQIIAEAKDGSTYFAMKNGFLGKFVFDDTAVSTSQNIHVTFPCPASGTMRIRVVATGTTALNTFTMSNAKIFLRT